MILRYDRFEPQDIDAEIKKIEESEKVVLCFDNKQKGMLFLLGILFAMGKDIEVENAADCDRSRRSYFKAACHWVENGLTPAISGAGAADKIFLICPVTAATDAEKAEMMAFINEAEGERGFTVHYPARDTYQVDDIGYRIATDNSVANGGAQHIVIYYAQTSVGSYFDLGVSYYFQYADPSRTFTMMNEGAVVMDERDFGDRIVLTLLEKAGRLPERA